MFKTGDKVVCVDNEYSSLELHKVYEITKDWINDKDVVISHKGINTLFRSYLFISLLEYRKQKIQKICAKL
jgi:hypothetical protein